MIAQSNIKLTIALQEPDLDAEQLERRTRILLQDFKELDEVEQASLVQTSETPQGSKAFGGFLIGMLQAEVNIENLQKFLGFVGDRLGGKAIELEVEVNGRKLKLTASSQEELLAAMGAAEKFVQLA
ncbi:MAG: hypothetical protein QNJ51_02795 [Calothrix sp. MO_167.B12]|nr:hypothetical protein [Calothrix sp. MO_167.B12]